MRLLSKPVSLSKELESGIKELSVRKGYTFFRVKYSNPLNPNIKIQILICYPFTFSIEVVGRIC